VPACQGKVCGDNGCGGTCGACNPGFGCDAGTCICQPDCLSASKQCGPNGCGGSCGTCTGANEQCENGACVTANMCPWPGPYGTNVGDTIKDLTLADCDGNPVKLHDLCGANGAWVFVYAQW
jgi:hypothetical protein